jgi:hypothetical protein
MPAQGEKAYYIPRFLHSFFSLLSKELSMNPQQLFDMFSAAMPSEKHKVFVRDLAPSEEDNARSLQAERLVLWEKGRRLNAEMRIHEAKCMLFWSKMKEAIENLDSEYITDDGKLYKLVPSKTNEQNTEQEPEDL